MTIARIAAGLGLVAATLLGGTATATAAPAPHDRIGDYPAVTAWHDANVRLGCAGTTCPVERIMKAGESAQGICWRHGETVTAYGITNDIWIVISLEDGGDRNVSAVFLKGDKYANLPLGAKCDWA
jgi:hypothetical protein